VLLIDYIISSSVYLVRYSKWKLDDSLISLKYRMADCEVLEEERQSNAELFTKTQVGCLLTPHVDVSGASHIASGEHDEVQHVAQDAQRANDGQDHAVGELSEVFGPRVFELLSEKRKDKSREKVDCIHIERIKEPARWKRMTGAWNPIRFGLRR
jgi:hypothetical protein